MNYQQLRLLLIESFPEAQIDVMSEDDRHFQAIIVSESFQGLSAIARHRLVMKFLKSYISSDEVHALSLRLLTHKEWENRRT